MESGELRGTILVRMRVSAGKIERVKVLAEKPFEVPAAVGQAIVAGNTLKGAITLTKADKSPVGRQFTSLEDGLPAGGYALPVTIVVPIAAGKGEAGAALAPFYEYGPHTIDGSGLDVFSSFIVVPARLVRNSGPRVPGSLVASSSGPPCTGPGSVPAGPNHRDSGQTGGR